MDFSPAFSDVHSHQNDIHPSPMSLPPSAAPRSVAPKEESYTVNTDTLSHTYSSMNSRITTNMGPPPSVASYHPNSVAPSTPFSSAATPFTPRPADVSHLQPSLQYELKDKVFLLGLMSNDFFFVEILYRQLILVVS